MKAFLLAAAALAAASPSFAQDSGLPDPNDRSDSWTLAAGAATIPDYEGSDDREWVPFGAIRGRVSGFEFATRGTHFYFDLLRRPDSGVDFDFGPIVGFRRGRSRHIEDDIVKLFGKRKAATEVGAFAGVTLHGVTNPYDSLSFRVDAVHDIGKAHRSTVVSPAIDFGTPLSRTTFVGASLSADFVSNKYADYYYASPVVVGANTILYPAYDPSGGMKSWTLGVLLNQSVIGDLTHGLSVFAGGDYSRLVGDIGNSVIVEDRGSRGQLRAAAGLAYTF